MGDFAGRTAPVTGGASGIRVHAVASGAADIPGFRGLLDAAPDPAAGPGSGSTTGTVLAVDGGTHGLRPRPSST